MTTAQRIPGIPVPLPKPCKRRGCAITKTDGLIYHVSREGACHRGQVSEPMVWQRDVQAWAASVHEIMGWS